ncbi:MAG TPA: hypothetical protein VF933_13210 [Streptosporangiaceae bacterium]
MKFYRAAPVNTIPSCQDADDAGLAGAGAAGLPGAAVIIAIRAADLVSPCGRPAAGGDRTALVVAGTPGIRAGEQLVFVKVVAVAPAVVRRDGRIQAGGHPAGHARLGALEQQLDELAGPGVIDGIAAQAMLTGKVKGKARRAMTPALAIRATVLMGVLPSADYGEVMAALLGDLVLVPWHRPYEVPTGKVLSTWREALGPAPLAGLQARLLAAVGAEHRDHDYRAVHVGDSGHELRLGSIDGSVTRVPDTPASRAAFGSTGTADDLAPYPQVRDLLASDASTRGTLAVVCGPSGGAKAEGEQALLDTMLTTCPQVFTADRLWVMDRNFPGADRVSRMLATGTHVLIRVKSDIALPPVSGFLPDGSYYSYLAGGPAAGRWCLKVRVIEYDVDVDGQDTREMFCLISDLLDHAAYPAAQLAAAYAWRWSGSETALKEAKSVITGAGPSSGPIFRSQAPALISQEHAAWICGTELTRALARAAARQAAPARKGRLAGRKVQPRQVSFTAARRAALASIRSGAATASLPAAMAGAFHRDTLRALAKRRIVIDRHRHRDRKTKARQAFPAAGRSITTRTATARVNICQPAAA